MKKLIPKIGQRWKLFDTNDELILEIKEFDTFSFVQPGAVVIVKQVIRNNGNENFRKNKIWKAAPIHPFRYYSPQKVDIHGLTLSANAVKNVFTLCSYLEGQEAPEEI